MHKVVTSIKHHWKASIVSSTIWVYTTTDVLCKRNKPNSMIIVFNVNDTARTVLQYCSTYCTDIPKDGWSGRNNWLPMSKLSQCG